MDLEHRQELKDETAVNLLSSRPEDRVLAKNSKYIVTQVGDLPIPSGKATFFKLFSL